INDALGHFYGDYILQLTASRLREAVRDSDTVSRLGGDEFAVVGEEGDPDARPHVQAVALHHEGLGQGLGDLLGHGRGLGDA
ncbi:diguanylate cyclase, partial [Dissulfurirhabdus thermomarina]|nr:diguanylate cyclase [Dissulfurirhabdus thermomarina]